MMECEYMSTLMVTNISDFFNSYLVDPTVQEVERIFDVHGRQKDKYLQYRYVLILSVTIHV